MTASSTPQSHSSARAELNARFAEKWWVAALRGVLALILGAIALLAPGITLLSLILVFAAYVFVDGTLAIIGAVRAAGRHDKWALMAFEGVVGMGAGAAAIVWPEITALVFAMIVAAWAIVTGGLMIWAASMFDAQHGRWWMVLGGAASVMLGALLFMAPLVGLVALALWIGIYAVVFSVTQFILAYQLRFRRPRRPEQHDRAHPISS
jgi:uncharacterized membrane protein HdeD (DUF308 family)